MQPGHKSQSQQNKVALLENLQNLGSDDQNYSSKSAMETEHHYDNYRQYLLSLVGFAVGFGSFWRFPYLVYKNGGGVFLIPYFLALFLVGIPLLYLETVVGQMHQRSVPLIFGRINRGFKMLGAVFLLICFHLSGYYNIILTYSYRFLFSAFVNPLPFAQQSPIENTYFTKDILQKSGSIQQFGGINIFLFLLYIMSMIICYFIVKKGVKTSGKIVTFTAILPYFFFLVLAIRGAFLQGAWSGIVYLLSPNLTKLFTAQIWIDAIVQVFYQMTVACSGIINLSSLKPKRQNYIQGIYIIPASIVVCGVLCALNIFMYLGHFSQQLGIRIDELQLSGPELSFNVFPKALAILPWSNLWVFCFFVAMVLLGIDSEFGYFESIFCYLKDQTKDGQSIQIFERKINLDQAKRYYVYVVMIFCPFLASYAGIYYMEFFDTFVSSIPMSAGALIELYIFVHYFPFSQLQKQTKKFTNTVAPNWIRNLLQGKLLLGILIGNLALAFLHQLFAYKQYSASFYIVGWFISLYPFGIALWYYYKYREEKSRLTFEQLKDRQSYL